MRNHFALTAALVLFVVASGRAAAFDSKQPISMEPFNTVYDIHPLVVKTMTGGFDFYPAQALRMGLEGLVSLAYSVDANGHADRIALVLPLTPLLDAAAVETLRHTVFVVPNDWVQSGGPERRYRFRVRFSLNKPETLPVDERPDMYITGSHLPFRQH